MLTGFSLKPTHCFKFVPKKKGVYEFALGSRRLFEQQKSANLIFPIVAAGLEPENTIRLDLRVFSDLVYGEIYTLSAIGGETPDSVKERNEKALAVAEAFLSDLKNAGFADWDVRIEEGPPLISTIMR